MPCDCDIAVLSKPKPTRMPENMKCKKCEHAMHKGRTITMIEEALGGEHSKVNMDVTRFYFDCPNCGAHIIFRSNLLHHAFVIEYGAIVIEQWCIHPKERRRIEPVPEGVCDPDTCLERFPDSVASMVIVKAIECTLDYIRRSESVGNVSDQEIYIQGAQNIQNGLYPNKCPHFVIRNDDKVVMGPFVKMLTKVTWNHLPNFLKELRDFLITDKYFGIVFPTGEPNKRGKDKVAIPTSIHSPETNVPFLEAVNLYSRRDSKAPLSTALVHHSSVLLPFSMKCSRCSNEIRKGEKYSMLEETFGQDSPVLRLRLVRYYLKCPKCSASMVFRCDLRHTKYIAEFGIVPSTAKESTKGVKEEEVSEPVDPMSQLSTFPKVHDAKRKEIDDLEKALFEFRLEMENSIVDVWEEKVKKEREEEATANVTNPTTIMEKRPIRPFADTIGMVPALQRQRFYAALLHQLATEQFIANTTPYFSPFTGTCTTKEFLDILNRWWKKKHYSNVLAPKLTMVPFGMKCLKCSNCIYKGKKLEMSQEIVGADNPLLRMILFRFYMNCPHCSSPMIFRSNLLHSCYIKEFGIELLPEDCKKRVNDKVKEKYCNPMRLLKKYRPLSDKEKKLIQDIEDNIEQIARSEEERIMQPAKMRMLTMIRCEIDNQLKNKLKPKPVHVRDWNSNPFSDTVQLVPEFHTSRFIQAVLNQLATPEFVEIALRKPRHYIRDNYQRQIEANERPNTIVTPSLPTLLPIQIQCKKCSKTHQMGQKFDMKKEVIEGLLSIPIKMYRYYFNCPNCSCQIVIRSEMTDQDFRVEYGAEKIQETTGLSKTENHSKEAFDPRTEIRRFNRDKEDYMTLLDNFESEVTHLMFEADDSPHMQNIKARVIAEKIAGYIGSKHPDYSTESKLKHLFKEHTPFGLSVKWLPDNGIYHAMAMARKQLLTDEFRSTMFHKN